mmetsp:Transcript_30948/g.95568  ORF Transcript_30948/g.95568 Transcript_30948/m.95568 type:complete len:224 (-) Transcript_30948:710-1381(-)
MGGGAGRREKRRRWWRWQGQGARPARQPQAGRNVKRQGARVRPLRHRGTRPGGALLRQLRHAAHGGRRGSPLRRLLRGAPVQRPLLPRVRRTQRRRRWRRRWRRGRRGAGHGDRRVPHVRQRLRVHGPPLRRVRRADGRRVGRSGRRRHDLRAVRRDLQRRLPLLRGVRRGARRPRHLGQGAEGAPGRVGRQVGTPDADGPAARGPHHPPGSRRLRRRRRRRG